MKRILCTILVLLGLAAMSAVQAASTPGPQAPTTTQRRTPPAPKTAEEGAAFQAIIGNPDVTAAEAATKDFEAKYPQSELTGGIYQNLMYRYQQVNDAEKTVEMGRKAIGFDADNPMALVTVASVLSERTKETDLDAEQRLAEATKDAQHALDTMDAWLAKVPGITDQQAQGLKPLLGSFAQAALGMVEMKRKNPAEAEKHFRASVELNTMQPEAVTWLRLALALDAQKKYADALTAANRAVELSAARGGMVADWAKQEQSRLSKLTGQAPPPAPAPAPAPPPPPTTPKP
jgi:tetratricopeptide (TPR) repeat protein